jgi:acyl carrier protein
MTNSEMALRDALRSYIRHELLKEDPPDALGDDTPLLSSGLLDSLALEQLMFFIEDSYGLVFEDDALSAVNFETIRSMADLVAARLGGHDA